MRPTLLDSDAKEALRKAVRTLRPRLIEDILDAARGEYQLDLPPEKARLPEARRLRRERLDGWIDEQIRAGSVTPAAKGGKATRSARAAKGGKAESKAKPDGGNGSAKGKNGGDARRIHLCSAVKEAAHTLLNRLVFLRILEHHGVLSPAVVTGGWKSPAYEKEYTHYAGALMGDETRGYQALLEVVFAEMALDLPGLFGPVGLTALFPVPAATLRAVVEMLNEPALASAWGDDTTLGWIYQYWNDPERERLDAKIAGGGKIEPHEIASKTQMFTERYMVEWLLQNSLGLTWLSICKKKGWTAEAESVLPVLDARRAEFREKRERGEVPLDALMPVEAGLESGWKYYVPQPLPEDAAEKARDSIREVRLLDPACGSGHFLVIAFDLLARMYEEEARHRGETWTAAEIAESILANNLYGIDIDPRAIQIAAAGLWLKAKLAAPGMELRKMNLVAPSFRLASLPKDDPALERLKGALKELRIPPGLTMRLVEGLRGVDYLGTLLRVGQVIADVVEQGPLLVGVAQAQREALDGRVAEFLDAHAAESDLGLRLEGEQLAAGLRFMETVREGTYDLVVGNPPYLAISKRMADASFVASNYPRCKADLYAAFLERGHQLTKPGGNIAFVTMRGWLFLGQLRSLRQYLLSQSSLRLIGDVDRGAFSDVPDEVLSVCMSILGRSTSKHARCIVLQPTPLNDRSRDSRRTARKTAALLAQIGRFECDLTILGQVAGTPVVYWWSAEFLGRYVAAQKLGDVAPVKVGANTGNNSRFVRYFWECGHVGTPSVTAAGKWAPYVLGSKGRTWFQEHCSVVDWQDSGLQMKVDAENRFGPSGPRWKICNENWYFKKGIAFSPTGNSFTARAHRYSSVFDVKGSSVFPQDIAATLCLMNTTRSKEVMQSLNPSISFQVGDVNRLPMMSVANADAIYATLEDSFAEHESSREASIEFVTPRSSCWRYAQEWAQRAVDRPEGAPLAAYIPEYDPPASEAPLSFAVGIALGRFGANGEGILDTAPPTALPAGILFLGPGEDYPDSLTHPATAPLLAAWNEHRQAIVGTKKTTLRDYLRKDFFAYHKSLYENRPIYFPLSSPNRTFVAWVSIHRWADDTLQTLLVDHLNPILRKLDGEIKDVNATRNTTDKKTAIAAEEQYDRLRRLRDELWQFVQDVTQCAERGAPPTDSDCDPREIDAPFHMDLDDGVMINSAALWPLLAPQWSDPKKWWKQLCVADGRKDYDWAHLARRYFPDRVDRKCQTDPSLAVAHGCFWKYHPAKAYAWELRLQDEIRPDFTIDEPDSDAHRAAFLAAHAAEARDIEAAEERRRIRKADKLDADEPTDPDPADPDDSESE